MEDYSCLVAYPTNPERITANRKLISAEAFNLPNLLHFRFEDSTYRCHRRHKECHLVRVRKHCVVIIRSKRAHESRCKCLTKLPCVVIDVIIPMIDIIPTDLTIFGFLQQAAAPVPLPIHANAIIDAPRCTTTCQHRLVR